MFRNFIVFSLVWAAFAPLYAVNDLVDLSNVATEQRSDEYAVIEQLEPIAQSRRIFNGMKEAALYVSKNNQIPIAIKESYDRMILLPKEKRRIFIAGAGTSGRLAAINAIESESCQAIGSVQFSIAGGVGAFVKAVEGAEDNRDLAYADVEALAIASSDIVIALSASGRTPYAIAYLEAAKQKGAYTIGIDNTPDSPLSRVADLTISNRTGPECPRGSTRMKAGTSQYETLRLYTLLLDKALEQRNSDLIESQYAFYTTSLLLVFGRLDYFVPIFPIWAETLSQSKSRIVYKGDNIAGLLGAVDGSELGPTYTWDKTAYRASMLAKIVGDCYQEPHIEREDFVFNLDAEALDGENEVVPLYQLLSPLILGIKDQNLINFLVHAAVNVVLKIITTQFAILSGWVLEGEMIHLDPQNPNLKLVARRVQTLKNLTICTSDEEAAALLSETQNDLALAVIMRRKELTIEQAKERLEAFNFNVIKALSEDYHLSSK